MVLKLDMIQMASLSVLVLFIGQKLRNKINFLDKYCIPAPVIGGIVFAIVTLIMKQTGLLQFEMDNTLQHFFMISFFTTVGFSASFKMLKSGGKEVILFLCLATLLVVCQDVIGVLLAKVFDLHPLIGLSTGSVPMTGGHGTSGSFAPKFEDLGAIGATTVAMAAATFGLIAGSSIGGPIAKLLIEKHNLKSSDISDYSIEDSSSDNQNEQKVSSQSLLSAACTILLAMGLGTIISILLEKTGMTFPSYIGAMFAAAIIRNIADLKQGASLNFFEIDILGNTALSLFLAMALMSLKLWELSALALPLIIMLTAQVLLMAFFAYFITFNVMGRSYDAAVMAGGHCGFGMGATPNAIANMSAISSKFGPSYKAFFILPLVGSLFIDFINAGIITFFTNLF